MAGKALAGRVCFGRGLFLARRGFSSTGVGPTTHWAWRKEFRRRVSEGGLQTDMLITEDAGLWSAAAASTRRPTSASTIVERLCGREIALQCSKALLLDMPRLHQSDCDPGHIAPAMRFARCAGWRSTCTRTSGATSRSRSWPDRRMSARNLIRRFKAATGCLPGAYLQMVRVAAARRCLENGAASVQRVVCVGYEDTTFFRRIFKRYSGMPRRHTVSATSCAMPRRIATIAHPDRSTERNERKSSTLYSPLPTLCSNDRLGSKPAIPALRRE